MKKYVENDTAHMMYAGGCAIAPGEGREVDVPEALPVLDRPDEEAAPDTDGPLRELLKSSVAVVAAALAEFGADTLARLAELEAEAEKPRKGVLSALADERIKRADAALTSDPL
ncbi:MAG: hypothetical protein A3E79_11765 [Burkholderiales bacterium RIFCSPHIGHO2_12_FULL_61_11]|nr:MAG: hypothetical protein A3E79_11765 [Burkholderiales bacterium RIFCSPHIGHO2_12_FULL_61_11]